MKKSNGASNGEGRKWSRTHWLLMLAIAVVVVLAGTMARSVAAQRGDDRERDDRREFQNRGGDKDDDWDDHDRDHRRENYAIGLWGDMPYSAVQADGVLDLIDDMNSQDLAFTVHDGDLKAGKGTPDPANPGQFLVYSTCNDALYTRAIGFFNMLRAPAAFTPGDNDWTDCDVPSNGNFNSLERLSYERTHIFNVPHTLGMHTLHQAVQTDTVHTPCRDWVAGDFNGTTAFNYGACVENRRWTYRGVTYATLNIQGSCDNGCKDHPDKGEAADREAAARAWMEETFQVAKDRDSAAIMFISQADPSFNDHSIESEALRDPKTLNYIDTVSPAGTFPAITAKPAYDGFGDTLRDLRSLAKDFRKPVAWVHGDTHYFHIDKPLYDDQPAAGTVARRLENFTRVETFGDNTFVDGNNAPLANANPDDRNNVHWVKVFVDPDSREVFAFQPQIVPRNRVVVPAP